jgi:hypothetical protein
MVIVDELNQAAIPGIVVNLRKARTVRDQKTGCQHLVVQFLPNQFFAITDGIRPFLAIPPFDEGICDSTRWHVSRW